jgi:hypothetical protein
MAQEKHNNKIPPSPFETDYGQTRQDLYADCFHEWETCLGGTHSSKYRDPQNPKGMFDSHADPTGAIYNTDCNQGNAITSEAHPGAHRYWSMNTSEHVGGHRESVTWNGVHNQGSQYEASHTTTDNMTSGAIKMKGTVSGDHFVIRTNASGQGGGSSDISSSAGSQSSLDSDGNRYINHEGNTCHTYNGHTYIIAKGDHGLHAQGGNIDHHADSKLQMYGKTAAYINSATTVILQAGTGTATITMTGDTVTIKASKIVLDGECHIGGSGGTLAGLCGGGCATKVFLT